MSTESIPVLIVGGGSVGLAAAVFLAHRGVPAVLVERRAGLSIHPRAIGLGVRSLEMFRGFGLEPALRDAAAPLANNSGWISVETLASPDLPAALARRPRPAADALARFSPTTGLACSQDALDPVLHDDALRHGARIEYGTELVALDQDAGGVTARLVRLDGGGERAVRADYLIAADGAGSFVRRALGISSGGPGLGPHLINALFEADLSALLGDRPFQLCEVKNPGFTGMLIAIRGARRFVLHFGYDPDRGERTEDFTPDRCRAMIRAAIGLPDVPVQVLSIRPWRVAARLADRFRDGRCFLAGDAAHVVPPTGGFGMNTGFADAHNLAWKLALALAGKAGPGLLDSYDAERRPVAGFTMDQAILRLLHPHLHFDPSRTAEQAQAGIADSAVVHLGLGYAAGAVVGPRAALASLSDLALDLDGAPGTRLPHRWVERGGERVSTLDLVGPGFLLLSGPGGGGWCAAAAESAARLGIDLSAYRVGPGADVPDPDGGVCSALGIGDGGALLVRPDGFVGWQSPTPDADPGRAVRRALRRLLGHAEDDG